MYSGYVNVVMKPFLFMLMIVYPKCKCDTWIMTFNGVNCKGLFKIVNSY